jgi:hypothetical protein
VGVADGLRTGNVVGVVPGRLEDDRFGLLDLHAFVGNGGDRVGGDMSATKTSTAGFPDLRAIAAARSARSRPVMPTRAPLEVRPIATALPIPPVPPVINTILPAIGGVTVIVSSLSFVGSRDQGGRLREPFLRHLCARAFRFGWESLDGSIEQPDDEQCFADEREQAEGEREVGDQDSRERIG